MLGEGKGQIWEAASKSKLFWRWFFHHLRFLEIELSSSSSCREEGSFTNGGFLYEYQCLQQKGNFYFFFFKFLLCLLFLKNNWIKIMLTPKIPILVSKLTAVIGGFLHHINLTTPLSVVAGMQGCYADSPSRKEFLPWSGENSWADRLQLLAFLGQPQVLS